MAVHRFVCTEHPSTLGGHAPALSVASGDTVITQTVDSYGHDASGVQRSTGDNPLTGPFHVDGARPGDTLVVRLDRIAPNRVDGRSLSSLVPSVVDPWFVRDLPPSEPATWQVDAGHARLATGGRTVTVPVRPMLGCLGVAPPHDQALWSGTAGRHGGNMDYRGYRAGVTAYFPVFVPGALFYLGDGHAAQGAGEVAGNGIEISMDVRFTVEVRPGGGVGWPRGEDDRSIWTVGNARPLEQALQHATTEMLRWLRSDFGHDTTTASALLAQAVEYDVGNVCDPAYTMVCRLDKDLVRA